MGRTLWIADLPSIGVALRPTLVGATDTRDRIDSRARATSALVAPIDSWRHVVGSDTDRRRTRDLSRDESPHGGSLLPTSAAWRVPSIVCVGVVALLVALAQRGSPARRAALFASATAVMWALEATFIRATTDTISALGFGGAFTRWPVYALIVGGAIRTLVRASGVTRRTAQRLTDVHRDRRSGGECRPRRVALSRTTASRRTPSQRQCHRLRRDVRGDCRPHSHGSPNDALGADVLRIE